MVEESNWKAKRNVLTFLNTSDFLYTCSIVKYLVVIVVDAVGEVFIR